MNRRVFLSSAVTAAIASTLPGAARASERPGGLRLIERAFDLSAPQKRLLEKHGFSILADRGYPSFSYAYSEIYSHDLPLFVTADSLLGAMHRTFSDLLKTLERDRYSDMLVSILTAMRSALSEGVLAGMSEEATADIDLYLAVALSLLLDQPQPPLAGADAAVIAELTGIAQEAEGMIKVRLFGEDRQLDASQFTPRGHYEHGQLRVWFKAMIWLGRVEMRLMMPDASGALELRRREFDAAVGLRLLMDQPTHEQWQVLDAGIGAFIGASDNLTPPQLDDLMGTLSIDGPQALAALSDHQITKTILEQDAGQQQILSHLLDGGTDRLMPRIFLLLGQRYAVDSHALSAVVYDRVGGGTVYRMMPDPLDVAYAALGNDQAKTMLADQLAAHPYEAELEGVRGLIDASGGWSDTLYTAWLACLRALSVVPDAAPEVAKSAAWGRRILSTQLASWAELRHDTILYVKQSYSAIAACEFPDAFVEPCPAFFDAVADYARLGQRILADLQFAQIGPMVRLEEAAVILGEMARHQEAGEPFTDAQMDFINTAVARHPMGSGGDYGAEGWYPELFTSGMRSIEDDPVIADVHTQPSDEVGNIVGRILHVAAGRPRLMVVTVETCKGPRAYVGPVSAYREVITEDFKRLTDSDWSQMAAESEEVDWMADLVR